MTKIVDLDSHRPEQHRPLLSSYFVRVDLYADAIEGELLDFAHELSPDQRCEIAAQLNMLSLWLTQQAFAEDGDDDKHLLATAKVFGSSRVTTWKSDEVQAPGQYAWLDDRFDDAKEAVRLSPPPTDTGKEK